MAPPPAHLIFRKVCKDYVRKIMKYSLRDTEIIARKLDAAAKTFGEESQQYKTLSTQFETVSRIEDSYEGYVRRLGLHKPVMKLLERPKRKKEDKNGKEHFFIQPRKFNLKGLT